MTLMPLLTLGGALVQLLGVLLIAWWMVRGLWLSGTRCWRYVRVPAGTVYLSADHSLLTVGDVVTMRGRADDGVVFNVKRTIAALNDTRVTLSSIALLVLLLSGSIGAQCVKPCDPPPTCLKNCDPSPCVKNCTPPPNDPCVKNCPPPPSDPQAPYQMTVGDLYSSWRGNDLAATIGTKAAVSGLQTLLNNVDDPGVNPIGAGALNYEHLMRGTADPRNWFAPRLGRFDLSVVDWQTVRLTRAVQDDPWKVGATITYRSVAPAFIDVEAAFLVTDATQFAPYHDALFFFASYMYNTSVAPHFRGIAGPDQPETWLTMPLEADANAGTVRHVSAGPLLYDAPNTFDAAYSFFSTDYPRFTQPFYCGLAEPGMVYEIMFDRASTPVDQIRFVIYQTKVPDGTIPHPAWDWEYILHQPVSGQTYGFKARMGWRLGTLEDCRADYATWAASLP